MALRQLASFKNLDEGKHLVRRVFGLPQSPRAAHDNSKTLHLMLPPEIWHVICTFSSTQQILALSRTCKYIRSALIQLLFRSLWVDLGNRAASEKSEFYCSPTVAPTVRKIRASQKTTGTVSPKRFWEPFHTFSNLHAISLHGLALHLTELTHFANMEALRFNHCGITGEGPKVVFNCRSLAIVDRLDFWEKSVFRCVYLKPEMLESLTIYEEAGWERGRSFASLDTVYPRLRSVEVDELADLNGLLPSTPNLVRLTWRTGTRPVVPLRRELTALCPRLEYLAMDIIHSNMAPITLQHLVLHPVISPSFNDLEGWFRDYPDVFVRLLTLQVGRLILQPTLNENLLSMIFHAAPNLRGLSTSYIIVSHAAFRPVMFDVRMAHLLPIISTLLILCHRRF